MNYIFECCCIIARRTLDRRGNAAIKMRAEYVYILCRAETVKSLEED